MRLCGDRRHIHTVEPRFREDENDALPHFISERGKIRLTHEKFFPNPLNFSTKIFNHSDRLYSIAKNAFQSIYQLSV